MVVASGQSASKDEVTKLRGNCRVLTINTSYQLAPWADAMYACDGNWWRKYHAQVAEFSGLKITYDESSAKQFGLKLLRLEDQKSKSADQFQFDEVGKVGRGGFGGFHAVNLVAQFGANPIGVIGFDFQGDHWHGLHPQGLSNPRPQTLDKWAKIFDAQKPILDAAGIALYNLSKESRAVKYPRCSVDEFISTIQRKAA